VFSKLKVFSIPNEQGFWKKEIPNYPQQSQKRERIHCWLNGPDLAS